jgi:hypothetical protein
VGGGAIDTIEQPRLVGDVFYSCHLLITVYLLASCAVLYRVISL